MSPGTKEGNQSVVGIVALACILVAGMFAWQGHKGFSFSDESYLWYGVQRVMAGEVPSRDFIGYDPGRYYWASALMTLYRSNGVIALRVAMSICEAMALIIGLCLIARNMIKPSFAYIIVAAVTLLAWMFPYYKITDISACIFLFGGLAGMVRRRDALGFFFAGLALGAVAIVGRNHALYGIVATGGIWLWMALKPSEIAGLVRLVPFWLAGLIAGFSPVLIMVLFMPGFGAAYWGSLKLVLEVKATNIPLPVPWPWLLHPGDGWGKTSRKFVVGLFFIALIAGGIVSLVGSIVQRLRKRTVSPELVTAGFMILPYSHYAYSRADTVHLALGIFPLLIGALAWFATLPGRWRWSSALLLCFCSVWVMGWRIQLNHGWSTVVISGSPIRVDRNTTNEILFVDRLVDQYASHGENFIFAPTCPGAYALYNRKSPLWENYACWQRTPEFQEGEIERIKQARPVFAVIDNYAFDGQENLRYSNSHAVIYRYIQDHFRQVENNGAEVYTATGDW